MPTVQRSLTLVLSIVSVAGSRDLPDSTRSLVMPADSPHRSAVACGRRQSGVRNRRSPIWRPADEPPGVTGRVM
jgi:hypothetical protein